MFKSSLCKPESSEVDSELSLRILCPALIHRLSDSVWAQIKKLKRFNRSTESECEDLTLWMFPVTSETVRLCVSASVKLLIHQMSVCRWILSFFVFLSFFLRAARLRQRGEASKENIYESRRVKSLSGCAGKIPLTYQTSETEPRGDFCNPENRTGPTETERHEVLNQNKINKVESLWTRMEHYIWSELRYHHDFNPSVTEQHDVSLFVSTDVQYSLF